MSDQRPTDELREEHAHVLKKLDRTGKNRYSP